MNDHDMPTASSTARHTSVIHSSPPALDVASQPASNSHHTSAADERGKHDQTERAERALRRRDDDQPAAEQRDTRHGVFRSERVALIERASSQCTYE